MNEEDKAPQVIVPVLKKSIVRPSTAPRPLKAVHFNNDVMVSDSNKIQTRAVNNNNSEGDQIETATPAAAKPANAGQRRQMFQNRAKYVNIIVDP